MAAVSGTPGSGSLSAGGGDAKARKQAAKRGVKREAAQIAVAIKLLPTFAQYLVNVPRGQTIPVNVGGRVYDLGQKNYRELEKLISSAVTALPDRAFAVSKTKRAVTAGAGFQAPAYFDENLVRFFANAPIGPVVQGGFRMQVDRRGDQERIAVPTGVINGSRLQDLMYFTQPAINGQNNPLYRIISPGTITPLFALHSFYATPKMQKPNARQYLSASNEMRTQLRELLVATIQRDVAKFTQANPGSSAQLQATGQQLIQAIDNPSLEVPSMFGSKQLFNPNSFRYADISKIISAAKVVTGMKSDEFARQLTANNATIQAVYAPMSARDPQLADNLRTNPNTAMAVLAAQHDSSKLASKLKNSLGEAESKQYRKNQAALKKQAQSAGQMPIGAATGVSAFPTGQPTFPGAGPVFPGRR